MDAADVLDLGLSPGFKFNPDDEELVEYFLLRRLLGQKLPLEGMIYEDDPLRAPPWKLLSDHGRKGEAFFFAAGHAIHGGSSRRQKRTCEGGGCWEGQGQKGRKDGNGDNKKLRVVDSDSGGVMEVEWKKYMLNFHIDGEDGSTGWVMHEYVVTAPAGLVSPTSIRAYRIRLSGHGKKRKWEAEDSDSCGVGDEEGGLSRAAARRARTEEPDLAIQDHISGASSFVFPHQDSSQVVTDDYQPLQVDFSEGLFVPDNSSWFEPAAADLRTLYSAAPSDQDAPGVVNGATAPAAGTTLPLGQESSSTGGFMDEPLWDFVLPENMDLSDLGEFLDFTQCGLQQADLDAAGDHR